MGTVKCAYCGKEFEQYRQNHKYCGKECYLRSYGRHLPRETAKCPICGATFAKKFRPHKYCSAKCRHQSQGYDFPKKTEKCLECGVKFQARDRQQKFCSAKCRERFRRRQKSLLLMLKPCEFDCLYCGKHVVADFGDRRRKYCCEKHGRWYSEKKRAENCKSDGEKS